MKLPPAFASELSAFHDAAGAFTRSVNALRDAPESARRAVLLKDADGTMAVVTRATRMADDLYNYVLRVGGEGAAKSPLALAAFRATSKGAIAAMGVMRYRIDRFLSQGGMGEMPQGFAAMPFEIQMSPRWWAIPALVLALVFVPRLFRE